MSLLPNQSYANTTTPLWVPAGQGGGGSTGPTGPSGPTGTTGPTGASGGGSLIAETVFEPQFVSPFQNAVISGNRGNCTVSSVSGSVFSSQLASGPAVPGNTWLMDFSSWTLHTNDLNASSSGYVSIEFVDTNTSGGPYFYTIPAATYTNNNLDGSGMYSGPIYLNLGSVAFDIGAAYAAGLRDITAINLQNLTNANEMYLDSWGFVRGLYFPLYV